MYRCICKTTAAATISPVITRMYSLMTRHSAKILMETVTEIMLQGITVTHSNLTQPNGRILMAMVMGIITGLAQSMAISVQLKPATLPIQSQEDARTQTVMVSSIPKTRFRKTPYNGQIVMVTDMEMRSTNPVAMTVLQLMAPRMKITAMDAKILIMMVGQMLMMNSHRMENSGRTLTAMVMVTITSGQFPMLKT